MSRTGRVRAEFVAAWNSFLRRRTAVFFTFFFPVILIVIFAGLVRTDATGGGLFTKDPGWYVPGYLAVVVLFTPLSRMGSEVARHREGNRFEKLATTPLTRGEWLLAQSLVNAVVIGLASVLVLGLVVLLTGAAVGLSPLLPVFVFVGVLLFCAVGAMLGALSDSQDGAVAASNAIGLPLLFLSQTFVQPDLLPSWFQPLIALSPLTYFAAGVRAATYPASTADPFVPLAILVGLAVVGFAIGAALIPRTD